MEPYSTVHGRSPIPVQTAVGDRAASQGELFMCYQMPNEHTSSCRRKPDPIKAAHNLPKMPDLGRMNGWERSISWI